MTLRMNVSQDKAPLKHQYNFFSELMIINNVYVVISHPFISMCRNMLFWNPLSMQPEWTIGLPPVRPSVFLCVRLSVKILILIILLKLMCGLYGEKHVISYCSSDQNCGSYDHKIYEN